MIFKLLFFDMIVLASVVFFLLRKEKETFQERMALDLIMSYNFSEYFFKVYLILIWLLVLNLSAGFWMYKSSIKKSITVLNKVERTSLRIPVFTPDGRVGLIIKKEIRK